MDELTLSQGIFNYQLAHFGICQKTTIDKTFTLSPVDRASFRTKLIPRNGEINVIPLKIQATVGKWIINQYTRAGNSFKRPRSIASLFQSVDKVSYYYTKKDYTDNKSMYDKVKVCDWINFQQVKTLPCCDAKVPILLPNHTLDDGASLDVVPIDKMVEIIALLKDEKKHSRGLILFQLGVDGLDQFVHPAIKIIASHMLSVRIASPGFGLNYDHPYSKAVFLRPFTNGMLSRLSEADLTNQLTPWKGKCIVLGNELSPIVTKVMGYLEIPRLPTLTSQDGTEISIYSTLIGHRLQARYFTFLKAEIVRMLLSEKDDAKLRKNVAEILFCSRALIPNPEPIVRLDELDSYEYGIVPTVNPYPLYTTALGVIKSWCDDVQSENLVRSPVLLIICAPKGSMKSALTKKMVDYFTGKLDVASPIRYGRVDSDAWGKWMANPKIFSSWAEFNAFQDNDLLKSQIEMDMEHFLKLHNITDINCLERSMLGDLQADFSIYLQNILTNQENGLEKFVHMLLQLPDLPRALLWEIHAHAEIGLLPPTHYICNLMPSWNTAYAVVSRPRITSTPLAQLALHGLYKTLSRFGIYTNVHLSECARLIDFCPKG
nr:P8 protein [Carrot reovirus 1]